MYTSLHFLPDEKQLRLSQPYQKLACQLLNHLHQESIIAWKSIFAWPIIKAAFIQKNPLLLQTLRDLYRQGMQHLCQEFNQHALLPEATTCLDFLYSWLSFFPYWEWREDAIKTIEIPHYRNKQWTCLSFKIETLELTANKGWSNLWLQNQDRYYVYILHRPQDSSAPTFIIYSGTTYPKGQGFISHLKSDLQPWHSVGETLLKNSAPRLKHWLEAHRVNQGIAIGLSLGGSLTLLTALAMPEHIQQGFALNPAGLITPPSKDAVTAPVRILIQGEDMVSKLGYWHPAWDLNHLSSDATGFHLLDHFRIYSGHRSRQYQSLNTVQQNLAHPYLNFFLFKLIHPLIYSLAFLPYYYLIRPILSLIWDTKWITLFSASLLLLELNPLSAIGLGILLANLIQANPFFHPEYFQQTFFLSMLCLISLFAFSLLSPVNAISTLILGIETLSAGLSIYEKLEPNPGYSI